MNKPAKVDGVVNFFRPLIAKGLPIHSIGMQAHMIYGDTDYITEYTNSIKKIASLGLKAQFTELDLTMLPNPYGFSGANISDTAAYMEAGNSIVVDVLIALLKQMDITKYGVER